MKLIKLSDTHYIVVDDSEIKEGDWVYYLHNSGLHGPSIHKVIKPNYSDYKPYSIHFTTGFGVQEDCKKITHSTPIGGLSAMLIAGVRELSLSEVEEVIYGYNVEKMAEDYINSEKSYQRLHFWLQRPQRTCEG